MEWIRQLRDWIANNRIATAIVLFLLLCPVVISLSLARYSDSGFRDNLLAEAHGLLVELLVLGVLVLSLDKHRQRQYERRRFFDAIDEHRGWQSEHAATRLKGLIQRLNAEGITSIDLHSCYLKRVNLRGANLSKALLQQADLGEGYLRGVVFDHAQMNMAYLGHADLRGASFRDADMPRVRFQHSNLTGADFRGANLLRARFNQAVLASADLRGADVSDVVWIGADLGRANLRGVSNLDIDELLKAKTLEYSYLDESVFAAVKLKRPDLLVKYVAEGA